MEHKNQTLSIMVVDDDIVDQRKLIRLLDDASWYVFPVLTGKEAINILGEKTPDCILLDYNIPGTETLSLLDYFVHRKLPVIVVSGQINENIRKHVKSGGAFACLDKQKLTSATLTESIRIATQV